MSAAATADIFDHRTSTSPASLCPEATTHFNDADAREATRKLFIAIGICSLFMVAEVCGGVLSHSLAIISDAAHLLSDIAGLLISLFALTWARKRADQRMTYGYQRAEILGALLSISFVWALTVWLVVEAVDRLYNPQEINGRLMFIVATLGLIVNIIMGLALQQKHPKHEHTRSNGDTTTHSHESRQNINVRAAFLHVLGDLIQSVGVLIASALIWFNPRWTIADPLCTFLFSILVFGTTVLLVRDAVIILMEGVPREIDAAGVRKDLASIPGVSHIHDLHIWSLATGRAALTVHIVTNGSTNVSSKILAQCQEVICGRYSIHHSAVQIETAEDMSAHCRPALCSNEDLCDVLLAV